METANSIVKRGGDTATHLPPLAHPSVPRVGTLLGIAPRGQEQTRSSRTLFDGQLQAVWDRLRLSERGTRRSAQDGPFDAALEAPRQTPEAR